MGDVVKVGRLCFCYISMWTGRVEEPGRCPVSLSISNTGSEPGEAWSCEKTAAGRHGSAQVSGFGEAEVGCKMGPDHEGF